MARAKAIFLDRDGVLNREIDLLYQVRQLRVLPGVPESLKIFTKLGFLNIVITNQPVVARGWITEKGVERINKVLLARLARHGAKIDAVYYCPHHPDANLKKYRVKCQCRKPNTGMVKKAMRDFRIDPRKSFIIGDATSDIMLGKNAKIKTILVKTGYAGKDGRYEIEPDFIAKDLMSAAAIVRKYGK